MPVSDRPTRAGERDAAAAQGGGSASPGDPRDALHLARTLLRQVREANSRLGDALVAAGLPPSEWRTPEALLSELSDQFPEATVDALLIRLAEFAGGTGPIWLTGDGGALDDFEREAHTLGDVIRPLRALAQSQRITPASDRGWLALEQALGDMRVGAELDRLARALRDLAELAPLLVQLPPEATAEGAATAVAAAPSLDLPAGALNPERVDPWTGQPAPTWTAEAVPAPGGSARAAEAGAPAYTPDGIPIEDSGDDQDAPTYLMNGELPDARSDAPTVPIEPSRLPRPRRTWGLRPRTWVALLLTAAVLLVCTAVVTLASHISVPGNSPSAQATAEAQSELALAATATHIAARNTPTPAPPTVVPAAQLSVAPTSVVLACFSPSWLTLQNTGGQPLTWQASAPGNVILFPSRGRLDPGASATVQARATAPQHGSRTIVFSFNGGAVDVSYKVTCR
jgi:hypothetical protein